LYRDIANENTLNLKDVLNMPLMIDFSVSFVVIFNMFFVKNLKTNHLSEKSSSTPLSETQYF
jgi:hypothetical protein